MHQSLRVGYLWQTIRRHVREGSGCRAKGLLRTLLDIEPCHAEARLLLGRGGPRPLFWDFPHKSEGVTEEEGEDIKLRLVRALKILGRGAEVADVSALPELQ